MNKFYVERMARFLGSNKLTEYDRLTIARILDNQSALEGGEDAGLNLLEAAAFTPDELRQIYEGEPPK